MHLKLCIYKLLLLSISIRRVISWFDADGMYALIVALAVKIDELRHQEQLTLT
jgi:hypothetical protein